jgi:ppGpp synthetase/RelA/SpoT-type nucleotidyltranferase
MSSSSSTSNSGLYCDDDHDQHDPQADDHPQFHDSSPSDDGSQADDDPQAKDNCKLYDDRVSCFLAWYEQDKTQKHFEELATHTRTKCENLLETMRITGMVQCRKKKPDSLKEKLNGLAQDSLFRDWVSGESLKQTLGDVAQNSEFTKSASNDLKTRLDDLLQDSEFRDWISEESLKKKLGDMAGDSEFRRWVRDVSLMKFLAQNSNFRDWVSAKDHISKYIEMGDLAGVRIGLYFPDDIPKVAEEIEKHFDKKWLFGTVTGEREATKGRKQDIQDHMKPLWRDKDGNYWEHSGYKSWQIVVQWNEHVPTSTKDLDSLRVEIQIGTIVTQAWDEVQHNIIYKKPADILCTASMKRMIDGINGLAITTEIMLKELKRSLEEGEQEGRIRFQRAYAQLKSTEAMNMRSMQQQKCQPWVDSCHKAEKKLKTKGQANAGAHPGPTPWLSVTDFIDLSKELLTLDKYAFQLLEKDWKNCLTYWENRTTNRMKDTEMRKIDEEEGRKRFQLARAHLKSTESTHMSFMQQEKRQPWVDSWYKAEKQLKTKGQANAGAHPGSTPWLSSTEFIDLWEEDLNLDREARQLCSDKAGLFLRKVEAEWEEGRFRPKSSELTM